MREEIIRVPPYSVTLTGRAVIKIKQLLEKESPGVALRVAVEPGGCSGLRYQLFFTNQYAKVLARQLAEQTGEGFAQADGEEEEIQRAAMIRACESVVWFDGFATLIDGKSGPYLADAEIDYHDTIESQGFVIDNPNAQGSCGCGSSFQ
jgi:Fe-S cluster assembly iron-binding protein IscA